MKKTTMMGALAALVVLQGCAQPVGPTVQTMPGEGKSFAAFEADERACSMHVNDEIKPMQDRAAGQQLGAAALGTGAGRRPGCRHRRRARCRHRRGPRRARRHRRRDRPGEPVA